MPRFIKGMVFESAVAKIYPMKQLLPFLLAAILFCSGCDKKVATTTTTDSTGVVVDVQTEPADGPMDHVPGSTEPGPNDNDGSTPNDPVGNPPDGKPPVKDPPPGPAPKGNITVQSPQPNDDVSADQFNITGLARTFENNVVYRVKDLASGQILAQGFATAT